MIAAVLGRLDFDAVVIHVHEGICARAFVGAGRSENPCGWLCVDGRLFAVRCGGSVFVRSA